MKTILSLLLSFIFFVIFNGNLVADQQDAPANVPQPESPPALVPIEAKLQRVLENIFDEHPESIGLMVHVEAPDQNISWSGAIGHSDKTKKAPIDPAQPALIASNVKTYMAAAILRLVEDKKLATNQPIENLISKKSAALLTEDGYDLKAIQVSHLLTHTSGIHDYIDEDYFKFTQANPKHRWTRAEQIALAVKIGKPLGAPGDVFQYADINFLLLGEILEGITGKPFFTAIRELIDYEKLGLNETWFITLEDVPAGAKPTVRQYFSSMGLDSHDVDPSFDLYGAGGIAATSKDLARFSQSLFTGKIVRDEKTLQQIFTPAKIKDDTDLHYHFGLSSSTIEGFQAYGHGGFWGTVVQYFPELNASVAVFVLERDKRILRKDLLEGVVNVIGADFARSAAVLTKQPEAQFVNPEDEGYQTLVEQFHELASAYVATNDKQFGFQARARRFGHLAMPWETRQRSLAGSFRLGGDSFQLREMIASDSNAMESELVYSPGTLWLSTAGRASDSTVEDHASYLKTSCRYSPWPLLKHCMMLVAADDVQEEPTAEKPALEKPALEKPALEKPALGMAGDDLILKGNHNDEEFRIRFSTTDSTLKSIKWMGHHEMWGNDDTIFSYLRTSNKDGFSFAHEVREVSFQVTTFQCEVSTLNPEKDFEAIEVPESYQLRGASKPQEKTISVEKFSERVSFLELAHTDSRSVLVEFDEFLMVIDAPKSSANGQLIVNKVKQLHPQKPIRYFAFGHHHPHYLGGVRAFIANGTTIIATKTVAPYVRQLASFEHSRVQDQLADLPATLNLIEFENGLTIGSGNYEVRLFDIGQASQHTNDYLLFYFPEEKLLFQDDGISVRENGDCNARAQATYESILKLEGVEVKTCVQGWPTQNYGVVTKLDFQELVKAVERRKQSLRK